MPVNRRRGARFRAPVLWIEGKAFTPWRTSMSITTQRVPDHTAPAVNERIDRMTGENVGRFGQAGASEKTVDPVERARMAVEAARS